MLVLSDNQIGELGAEHIADLLQNNKVIIIVFILCHSYQTLLILTDINYS